MSSTARTAFRRRHFPTATHRDWNDWKWQMRCRIKDAVALEGILRLSNDERAAMARHGGVLPVGITPYYASLLDPDAPNQPIRKTVVITGGEYDRSLEE